VLRGEHEKSDRCNSSTLDQGIPSREEYLPLIIADILTPSYVRTWALCTLLGQAEQLNARLRKRTASIHDT
jgi:hypothetical protein